MPKKTLKILLNKGGYKANRPHMPYKNRNFKYFIQDTGQSDWIQILFFDILTWLEFTFK